MTSRTAFTRVTSPALCRATAGPSSSRALSSSSRTSVASSTSRHQSSQPEQQPEETTESLSRPRRDPNRNYSVRSNASNAPPPKVDPEMHMPQTNWDDPLYHEVAPPMESSTLIPPMSQAPLRESGHNIGVGPRASTDSSIRIAERGLHLHIRRGGHHIGPRNAFRGVQYGRERTAPEVSPTPGSSLQVLRNNNSSQLYMESVGGDYTRYLPKSSEQDYYDWQSTIEHAFAANKSVPPKTREEFKSKVGEILAGKAEYAKRLEKPAKEDSAVESGKPAGRK